MIQNFCKKCTNFVVFQDSSTVCDLTQESPFHVFRQGRLWSKGQWRIEKEQEVSNFFVPPDECPYRLESLLENGEIRPADFYSAD